MDPKELLALLDLDARPPAPPAGGGVTAHPSDRRAAPPSDLSPTALAIDAWGLRRGRELLAESERLRAVGTDEFAAADFFAAAFDPAPVLLPASADPARHRFVARLLESPEYRGLHALTRLDDTAAGIAAAHFAERFAALSRAEPRPAPPAAGGAGAAAGGEPAPPPAVAESVAAEVAALKAVAKAVAEAAGEVGDLREAAATDIGIPHCLLTVWSGCWDSNVAGLT